MKPFKEQLEEEAQALRLSAQEKHAMRVSIEAHMLAYPLQGVKSPWGVWVRVSQFAAAPMAILLIFAGTAYAAAGSLPGDLLYPVKIHVNEPVEVALATSPQAQVEVQQHLARERVSEAQALAAAGRLDATTTQELQDNFEAHASEAIAVAEHVALRSATTTEATSTVTATDTSVSAATTSATSSVTSSTAATSSTPKEGSRIKDTEDVNSLKASLTAQSDIFKALRQRIKKAKDSGDGEDSSTADSATKPSHKGNSHREGRDVQEGDRH